MKVALLLRNPSTDQGTFGTLVCGSFSTFISELPWRDNVKQQSCIPLGIYEVKWKRSPRFGLCYQVLAVPGRSNILLHAGNYVGDVSKGFRSDSYGCLLPSKKRGMLNGQTAGLLSKQAVASLASFFNTETFQLEIKENDYPSNIPTI